MYQIVGTSKIHSFVALDSSGNSVTTLTTPTVTYRINGGTKATLDSPTISAYDSDMRDFLLTVPDTLAESAYDTVEIAITATEGNSDFTIDIVSPLTLAAIHAEVDTAISDFDTATPIAKTSELPDVSGLATASALTTAQGGITAIKAVTDTVGGEFDATNGLIGALSIGESVGAEKVIPAAYYQLNAAAKTITLSTPYNGVTIEQIISIFDLTIGAEIYNCFNPRKRRSFKTDPEEQVGIDISVGSGATAGVISYIEDAKGIADTDKLMIVVNTP